MAPTKKQGLDYFPIFTKLTDREKYLLAKGGPSLLMAWFSIRMELYSVGCCLAWGEVEQVAFAREYSYEFQNISGIIQELFKSNLLSESVFSATGYLTSKDIQKQYILCCSLAKRKEIQIPRQILLLSEDELAENQAIILIDIKLNETKLKIFGNDSGIIPEVSNLPAQRPKKDPRTTVCTKESIPLEVLQELCQNPRYGDGDKNLVIECFEEMFNWSQSGQKRKADWAATLRNWILKRRRDNKPRQKTFTELEDDWLKKQSRDFLAMED